MTPSRQPLLRRPLRTAAAGGAVLLAAGICLGFAERATAESRTHVGTTVLLTLGTLACVTALGAAVVVERRPAGLVLAPGARLPAPSALFWAGPLLLTGLCDVVGGAYASPALLVAGALLVAVAIVGGARQLHRPGSRDRERAFDLTAEPPSDAPAERPPMHVEELDRSTVVAARRLQDFAGRHAIDGDAGVDCLIEHTGRDTARIVVVGRDGAFGDVLVRGVQRAERAVTLAGAHAHQPDSRRVGAQIRTGRYEWRRMAGMQLGGGSGPEGRSGP